MMRRLVAAGFALALGASVAQAAWPERPVHVSVPFAAGGITDVVARIMARRLQTPVKQPLVGENEPGAGGPLAPAKLARARPDGYALMSCPVSQITITPFTHKVEFDPNKDFTPIAIMAMSPFVLTVRTEFPANTLAEFISYVKSKPGQLTF